MKNKEIDSEEVSGTPGLILFIVIIGFISLMLSDITTAEMLGYMIGFSIVMLPLSMFFGTLKLLK